MKFTIFLFILLAACSGPQTYQISITDSGYVPEHSIINKGDTIIFVNEGTRPYWPAADLHPDHRNYPGSDIQKCATNERNEIFDACRLLNPGESYSFTFEHVGTWKYHDHSALFLADITVE